MKIEDGIGRNNCSGLQRTDPSMYMITCEKNSIYDIYTIKLGKTHLVDIQQHYILMDKKGEFYLRKKTTKKGR